MATVHELSDPYANHLLPVLPAGPGVCVICHTSALGGFAECFACREARLTLPVLADAVNFVALAVKDEQLARDLSVYKDARYEAARQPLLGLAAVLWRWLYHHEQCVATAAGVRTFPVITTVPTTKDRAYHPLTRLVGTLIGHTSARYQPLLQANSAVELRGPREPKQDRFIVAGTVPEKSPILLIDDTWTTGARAQSAVAALKASGAGPIAVVCIGRHFSRRQEGAYGETAEEYYKRAGGRGWVWERCCLCG